MKQSTMSLPLLPVLFLGFLSSGGCYTQLEITDEGPLHPIETPSVTIGNPLPPPPPVIIYQTIVECDKEDAPKRGFGLQRDKNRQGKKSGSGARPTRGGR